MPRVTQEHLDARREQILAAAGRCFARQGFHQTSMQEIFVEAGLSAGAVYRYFTSKEQLIETIVGRVANTVEEVFDGVQADASSASFTDTFEDLIRAVERVARSARGSTELAVQVWAEALHNPKLGGRVREVYATVHRHFTELARREQEAGRLDQASNAELVGRAMLSLLLGYILQRHLYGAVSPREYAEGVRMLIGMSAPGR